ncbi:membrane protein [Caballeronia peredens]|nr:membrane protein [Caballeronia peredens]
MKYIIRAFIISATLVAPVISFGQSTAPLTRAQVRAELIELEQAGYKPWATSDATYPAEIQAAQARVAQKRANLAAAKTQNSASNDTGDVVAGTSESGANRPTGAHDGMKPIYSGH